MIVSSKLAIKVMDDFLAEGGSNPEDYFRRLEFEAMKEQLEEIKRKQDNDKK